MSGKASRERRNEAVKLARNDVYKRKGQQMGEVPFENERQARIYTEQYQYWLNIYWRMENML